MQEKQYVSGLHYVWSTTSSFKYYNINSRSTRL